MNHPRGRVIDETAIIDTPFIYSLFVKYFENPPMYKIKDIGEYSLYATKIKVILNENRYIMGFVNKDTAPKDSFLLLSEIHWLSLQTRSLPDEHAIPSHYYIPKRLEELNKKIIRTSIVNNSPIYRVEGLPLTITLLPKKDVDEYSENGSVLEAIETYNTVITFNV